jgi:hypothetical protein
MNELGLQSALQQLYTTFTTISKRPAFQRDALYQYRIWRERQRGKARYYAITRLLVGGPAICTVAKLLMVDPLSLVMVVYVGAYTGLPSIHWSTAHTRQWGLLVPSIVVQYVCNTRTPHILHTIIYYHADTTVASFSSRTVTG